MLESLRIFAVECSKASVNGDGFCTNLPSAGATSANLQHIVQIILGILAVVAVLIIVIAGLNFVTAGGDPSKVAKARGTIIYALVGLAVTVTADAIVTFVIGRL
jgi:hypothetical protein